MKFCKIKADRIVNLSTIRTAQVFNNEIYLTFTCGDTRSDRIIFQNNQEAAEAFNKLCDALSMEVEE